MYNLTGYEYEPSRSAPRPHRTCNLRTSLGNERDSDFTFLCGSARGSRLELRAFPAGSRGRLLASDFLCRVLVASRVSEERNV